MSLNIAQFCLGLFWGIVDRISAGLRSKRAIQAQLDLVDSKPASASADIKRKYQKQLNERLR